jgi:gamma-glutamyltranspeptidase / glutathione hydrolase
MFTTRPEIQGTFGVVASTHWIASAVGMSMLERGGNAFDAGVAMGFVLQVLEPHLCGPGGDLPVIFHSAKTKKTEVLCAQGPAPAKATIEHYKAQDLDLVPGSGLLATVIPGAFEGWMTLLRDHGTLRPRDVLEPAIYYARTGHPILPRVCTEIGRLKEFFEAEWPTSASTWLVQGNAPEPRSLFRNEALARTYSRIVKEAETAGGTRNRQIEAARNSWRRGFVAETIGKYLRKAEVMDASGQRNKGVLTADDMAGYEAHYEPPATVDHHGWTVAKTGFWGQGPAFLQTLKLLEKADLHKMEPAGADFIHTVIEAIKLAFADREAYYGDPEFSKIPAQALLSEAYAAERRKLMGPMASHELRPGILPGFAAQVARAVPDAAGKGSAGGLGVGEPTMGHLAARKTARRGDTVHIDVVDRFGNMVSCTPSGGWLQSSPIVPGLGFCLNSRAQMFWLEEGLPASLAPGKRPRTTLSPSLALHEGRPSMVFGTPGGDQQDQWQPAFFLRHVHHGLNLQEAIDLPLFHTAHFPASFFPRGSRPGHLLVEESVGRDVIETLTKRGHDLEVAPAWSAGRLTAAKREKDGMLKAAATPRLMQAYAIGR